MTDRLLKSPSSTIIENLKQNCGNDSSIGLAYFYHDFRAPEKLLVRNLICSLIIQLSWYCSTPTNALMQLYSKCRDGLEQPSHDALILALRELSMIFQHTYIVVDALDECMGTERTRLIDFIKTVSTWGLDSVHLLATSRPEPDIQRRLCSAAVKTFDLEATFVDHDIRLYIKSRLNSEERLGRWGDAGKKLIEEKLTEGAHGM